MKIGEIIRKARENKGMSIDELAKYIDRSKSAISDLENYSKMPNFDTTCMLAEILEIDIKILWEKIKPEYFEKLHKMNKDIPKSISSNKINTINTLNEKEKRIQRGDG